MTREQHFDCLIIGAGISGIDAAYHLNTHCSWANYAILERRANLGGTWDFFKYPGIRSDSDMFTFGFSWKIWRSAKLIAPGEDILAYLNDAANEQGIMEKIMFNTDVRKAAWSSSDNRWHLTTTTDVELTCSMLVGCTGYYSYEVPYKPTLPGDDNFSGKIIHPQEWASEDDELIVGKKLAIIGSGATAVTILPNVAKVASHVTLVQRTPSYIAAIPEVDPVAKFLCDWLPESLALPINRWKNFLLSFLIFQYCRKFPERSKKMAKGMIWQQVKNVMSEEEFEKHFTPPYNPWDQRFCLTPDGDFFAPIRDGSASVVTDHIERITENGILMKNGQYVDADVIIQATGLTMQQTFPFSTMEVTIDGELYKPPSHLMYKSVMLSDVPNYAFIFGYTNASWTLKADIASSYIVKLLNFMRKNKYAVAWPRVKADVKSTDENWLVLNAGYTTRGADNLPKQGSKYPWKLVMNYFLDTINLWWGGVEDDALEFVPWDKKYQ